MKRFVLPLCLAFTCSAFAQDNWIPITKGTTTEYHGLKGSGKKENNKAGEEIWIITAKDSDTVKKSITTEKAYVRAKDCKAKQGKIVFLDMDGKFKSEFDFIFGAGNVGSVKAEFICKMFL